MLTFFNQFRSLLLTAIGTFIFCAATLVNAHNKVVVISMAGDDAKSSQFRIVKTKNNAPIGHGRLEYSNDSNPTAKSLWGAVCDDCFDGTQCPGPTPPSSITAAIAICKDLGFAYGQENSRANGQITDVGLFTLDDVNCPAGANSFSQCTATTDAASINCSAGESVYIECSDTLPKLVMPGFKWSCASGVHDGPTYSFPSDFVDFDDSDMNNLKFVSASFGEGVISPTDDLNIVRENSYTLKPSGETTGDKLKFSAYNNSPSNNCPDPLTTSLTVARNANMVITSTTGKKWSLKASVSVSNNVATFSPLVVELIP